MPCQIDNNQGDPIKSQLAHVSRPFGPNYMAVRLAATKAMQHRHRWEDVWSSERGSYMLRKTDGGKAMKMKQPRQ